MWNKNRTNLIKSGQNLPRSPDEYMTTPLQTDAEGGSGRRPARRLLRSFPPAALRMDATSRRVPPKSRPQAPSLLNFCTLRSCQTGRGQRRDMEWESCWVGARQVYPDHPCPHLGRSWCKWMEGKGRGLGQRAQCTTWRAIGRWAWATRQSIRWEMFLPVKTLRVLLVENDDYSSADQCPAPQVLLWRYVYLTVGYFSHFQLEFLHAANFQW